MTAARDQLYFDIFTTALEGGINYWAQVEHYHIWLVPPDHPDITGFFAKVNEMDGGWEEPTESHTIDRSVIAKGYGLAAGDWRNKIYWSSGETPPLFVDDDTDWDYDAGDADTIVQLGLGLIDTIRSGDRAGQQVVRYG